MRCCTAMLGAGDQRTLLPNLSTRSSLTGLGLGWRLGAGAAFVVPFFLWGDLAPLGASAASSSRRFLLELSFFPGGCHAASSSSSMSSLATALRPRCCARCVCLGTLRCGGCEVPAVISSSLPRTVKSTPCGSVEAAMGRGEQHEWCCTTVGAGPKLYVARVRNLQSSRPRLLKIYIQSANGEPQSANAESAA